MRPLHRFAVVSLLFLCGTGGEAAVRSDDGSLPADRAERVRLYRQRAVRARTAARRWAALHHRPLRRWTGRRFIELVNVRGDRPLYLGTCDYKTAVSLAVTPVRSVPYSLDGDGVLLGLWDGGLPLSSHREFGGRITNADSASVSSHATHMAGTLIASGVNIFARGMSSSARLLAYDWSDDLAELAAVAASAPGRTNRIYISSHSYDYVCGWEDEGDLYVWYGGSDWNAAAVDKDFGRYSSLVRDWDDLADRFPYLLIVRAAGNDRSDNPAPGDSVEDASSGTRYTYDPAIHPPGDGVFRNGYNTINPVAGAKNVLTVGAVTAAVSGSSRDLSAAEMTAFSCWGPTDDGRIKPDVVSDGIDVLSCSSEAVDAYASMTGTSPATAGVAGAAGLLVQLYTRLHPGGAMRAASLKGLLIHTADDLGRPGPDYVFGWGLVNIQAAADLLFAATNDPLRFREEVLDESAGNTNRLTFFSDGSAPLRITLCWTDPPGEAVSEADNPAPRLVNDLELRLVTPDGTVCFPWVLDPANPETDAGTGTNRRDNVEQIYLPAPAFGTYTLLVTRAAPLAGGRQAYSLFISGDSPDTDGDGLPDPWEDRFFGTLSYAETDDPDGDGCDNRTEFIAGTDPAETASAFSLSASRPVSGDGAVVLRWTPSSNRVYRVEWTEDLSQPFTEISGDLPFPCGAYTDAVQRAGSAGFYRLSVRVGP